MYSRGDLLEHGISVDEADSRLLLESLESSRSGGGLIGLPVGGLIADPSGLPQPPPAAAAAPATAPLTYVVDVASAPVAADCGVVIAASIPEAKALSDVVAGASQGRVSEVRPYRTYRSFR